MTQFERSCLHSRSDGSAAERHACGAGSWPDGDETGIGMSRQLIILIGCRVQWIGPIHQRAECLAEQCGVRDERHDTPAVSRPAVPERSHSSRDPCPSGAIRASRAELCGHTFEWSYMTPGVSQSNRIRAELHETVELSYTDI